MSEMTTALRGTVAHARKWSVENRLREWLAVVLAVVTVAGVSLPLILDADAIGSAASFATINEQVMRLPWLGVLFLIGGLLLVGGLFRSKGSPSGFAFVGAAILLVLYAIVGYYVARAVTAGAPSPHVSMYSLGVLISALLLWLYRTPRRH
jgi:hypothetical protein